MGDGDFDLRVRDEKAELVKSTSPPTSLKSPRRLHRPRDCSLSSCACCCHRMMQRGSYSWWLQYTPLARFTSSCDNSLCTGPTYSFTLRIALSELGIPWATVLHFQAYAGIRSFSLRPALWMERVVPYSAPGFELINNRFEFLENPSWSKEKLIGLYRADPSFSRHISPSGVNYLEVRFLLRFESEEKAKFGPSCFFKNTAIKYRNIQRCSVYCNAL